MDAFFEICKEAEPAIGCFVSLYIRVPFYGGPEEGGWWGEDVKLVAYQWCVTQQIADNLKAKIDKLADDLSKQSKREFGDHCNNQLEWLEARGLDSDFLPEVDGESEYFVEVEETIGSLEYAGDRHYS